MVVGLLLLFRAKWFFPLCALVTVVCLVVQQLAHLTGVEIRGFFFDGQWLSFALGIVVFYATTRLSASGQVMSCLALALVGCLLSCLPGIATGGTLFTVGFSILLVALRRWDDVMKNARVLWPLFACGTMCYSLYLVHSILVSGISRAFIWNGVTSVWTTVIVTVPVCVVASLSAGWAFYQLVERRFVNSSTALTKI
jgi:peptidoglycan/LPS O-acetylase OafA/YrhL